jgi:signal transduction histidine kinase/DNA-binding NarL/FixJ family response regulator
MMSEVERLEKRLERERKARIEAEALAEEGMRALYQKQREAELLRAVATAANEAMTVEPAIETTLELFCQHIGWSIGHVWLRDENDTFTSSGIWRAESQAQIDQLKAITRARKIAVGEGLVGRVAQTVRAEWIVELTDESTLCLGVGACLAAPLLIATEAVGVLELYTFDAIEPDPRIIELATMIGTKLGRVIERRRANEALLRATHAKSEFLANMSHEIRTPMTAVLGYADLLLDREATPSDRLNYVQTIRRNGEHLLSLLNDILDLSKIEAGKMTIERIACSPIQTVCDVASLMRVRALGKDLTFDIEYETAIPETIQSDPTRLRQILMNLVGNAIKFTNMGGVRILVSCDRARSTLSFRVIDQGIGMSAEQVARLFQPFTQADNSMTRKFGGSGLGLVICKRLADMMGGSISVASELDCGSTFTLNVDTGPLDGVNMIENLTESILPIQPQAGTPTRLVLDGTVLLAEDGVDNQALISAHLRKAGAKVQIAPNGRLAVEMALAASSAGTPFDVVLMDMQMPELDGYGATSKLRLRGYSGPIVALTAHAMSTDRDRCLAAGCDEYLTKPIQRDLLLRTVRGFMASRPKSAILVSEFANDEDMGELVDRFVSALPDRMDSLREALGNDDLEAAARIAHQLKGTAAGYGFAPITESAARLESALHSNTDVKECADHLIHLCSSARSRAQEA